MSRRRRLLVALLTGGLALGLPQGAMAGAWTRAAGSGQLVMSSGRKVAPVGAFASGAAERDESFAQIHVEVGLLESLTLGANLYTDFSATDLADGTVNAGLALRQRLHHDDRGNVVSVELSGALPAERLVSRDLAASNPDSTPEIGLSALYGTGWWGDWGSAWLSTAGGWVWRSEGTPDELRGELSGGYRPWACCLAMLGLYGTAPLSGNDAASLRIAPSLGYTFWPELGRNDKKPEGPINAVTLQIGLSYNLIDTSEGLGFQISWWRPF